VVQDNKSETKALQSNLPVGVRLLVNKRMFFTNGCEEVRVKRAITGFIVCLLIDPYLDMFFSGDNFFRRRRESFICSSILLLVSLSS
jgi:hypothetical protein